MKIFLTYTGTYLKPTYNQDHDNLKQCKLKIGETYQLDIKKPRNLKFHKKYFALLNLCFDNQEFFNDFESFREYIIIKSGYYIKTATPKGEFYKAKSISFANMDNLEFERLYNKTLDVIIADFLPISKEDIEAELASFY